MADEKKGVIKLDLKSIGLLLGMIVPAAGIGGVGGAYGPELISDMKYTRNVAVTARAQQINNMLIDLEIRLDKTEDAQDIRQTRRYIQDLELERDKLLSKLQ